MAVIDTTSLFLHILAAIGMVGGGLVQVLAGTRVRAATTGRELAAWASFTRTAGLLIAASAFLSLLTGGHLAGAVWGGAAGGFSNPFITLGVVGLLSPGVRADATSPGVWGPVHSLVGVGVGLVALMVYKPGWMAGSVLLVVTFALGWAAGVLVARQGRAAETGSGPSA